MKSFLVLPLVLAITLLLSACGAKAAPPPTLSAVDMQNTAAAVALTMIAGTQAAIPTATFAPPPLPTEAFTNTPAPVDTFLPQPTPQVPSTPVPASNPGGDSCVNTVLPNALLGQTVKIRINNSTKAALNLTVYLNQTMPENVCGYRAYTLGAAQSIVITDLVEGCYTLWAWNPDPKRYFMVTNGAANCINNSDTAVFDISTHSITIR